MSIGRSDDEDAIVLYHDICHVLARLNMVSMPTLEAIKLRLLNEATRSDDMDRYSLGIMAGLVTVYIVDSDETETVPAGYRKPRMGDTNWSTATDAPDGAEG